MLHCSFLNLALNDHKPLSTQTLFPNIQSPEFNESYRNGPDNLSALPALKLKKSKHRPLIAYDGPERKMLI